MFVPERESRAYTSPFSSSMSPFPYGRLQSRGDTLREEKESMLHLDSSGHQRPQGRHYIIQKSILH